MAVPLLAGAIGVLGAGFAKTATIEFAKFLGTRIMLYTLFTLILPVVLYNVFTTILEEMMNLVSSEINSGGMTSTIVELTGMGAWLGVHLRIAECLSVFLSAVGLSFVLRMLGR